MWYDRLGKLLVLYNVLIMQVSSYDIEISSNSPVLMGDTLTLNATIRSAKGAAPEEGNYCYSWMFKDQKKEYQDTAPNSSFEMVVDPTKYHSGHFTGRFTVAKFLMSFCILPSIQEFHLHFTDVVTGKLELKQKNETIKEDYVFSNVPINHTVEVDSTQWAYLKAKATSVQVTWIVNCTNVTTSTNLSLVHTYPVDSPPMQVIAIIDADFVPPTTTTTTTTTTTPKTTTSTSTTTSTTTTTTTPKPTSTTKVPEPATNTTVKPKLVKRAAHGGDISTTTSSPLDKTCLSKYVKQEPGHVYGYFQKEFRVRTAISNVTITGNNWANKGERVSLNFKCIGSPPISYCLRMCEGICNATKHERCDYPYQTDKCDLTLARYVYKEKLTMIVVIENDVSKVVKTSVITIIADPGNQGQLSVILVPVAFILISVTAVIYGIAYYVQNRRTAVVEVADFNFGDTGTDMEYKSFRQRLVESVQDTVNELRQNRSGVPTDLTGDSSVGYGSMK